MSVDHEPHAIIRDHVVNGGGEQWQYGPFARRLYPVADGLVFYFFGRQNPDQLEIPSPLLAFSRDDVRTLAHYKINENPNGLRWEIQFNSLHLDRPFYSLCETLAHELVHLYQESSFERKAKDFQTCRGGYHNKQFCEIAEEIGLHPKLGEGWHVRPADGQFGRLMDRWCVAPPKPVEPPKDEPKSDWWSYGSPKPKGSSSLSLYVCDVCPLKSPCKVRSGRRDLELACRSCGGDFQPA